MRSRRIEIPVRERSIDPVIAGTYWQFGETNGPGQASYSIVTITANRQRNYRFTHHGPTDPSDRIESEELGQLTLLTTRQGGVDLLLYNGEEGTFYMLLVRSRAGSLMLFPFLGELDTRIGEGRAGYLASVASRHGIELRWDAEAKAVMLDGKLGRQSLSALFGDPDFLGGLRLDPGPGMRLLPADRPLPRAEDRLAWWPRAWSPQLHSGAFPIAASDLVQPEPLLGRLCENGQAVTLSAERDGSVLMTYDPLGDGSQREPRRIRLLDIGERERFLALWEGVEGDPKRSVYHYFLLMLGPGKGAWQEPLRLASQDVSPTLDASLQHVRAKAAARHGLTVDEGRVGGNLYAGSLLALLADPQFQVGLQAEQEETWSSLEPALAQDGGLACSPPAKSAMIGQ